MEAFKPFESKGTPLEKQYRNWSEMVKPPYDKSSVDAYSRTRGILMNGVENNILSYLHDFARNTDDDVINGKLAELRRVEEQQQTTIDWSMPANQTVIETTLAFEQVATDLTANLAKNEPDPYVRQALDFALIEDFDHLFRYSALYEMLENGDPNSILQGKTEVKPGRPTGDEHRHPLDDLRRHYDRETADFKTKLNVWTITLGEQQTYLYYKTHGMMYPQDIARKLYAEIAEIEEEHVTQYEALGDPNETWLEKTLLLQAVEAYNYWSCLQTEPDPKLKVVWEEFYRYELEHIRIVGELLEKYEGRSAKDLIPESVEPLIVFEPNKEYVDQVVKDQINLRPYNKEFVDISELPADWLSHEYSRTVNTGGIPSEMVIEQRRKAA
ncbi:MAG: hypothetical protein M1548_03050 [Actinobacteria bacterium]|nr:hypothetical protein [Actinomycetota bacterium]